MKRGGFYLPRLIYSRDEAEAIVAVTPHGKDRILWQTLERTVGGEAVPGTDQYYLVRRAPVPGK